MQQLALKIDTPDQHARVLHTQGIGKVTIARKDAAKRWIQNSYSLDHLPDIARMLQGQPEVFISQNRFYGDRLIARLAQLDALFADLDYYTVDALKHHTPEQVYGLARERLEDANLPLPHLAIATGRGIALIWLHSPVPRQALPRWIACQKQLYQVLKPLGADAQALDAARVLRLVGTLNDTAKTLVRSLHDMMAAVKDFEALAEEILPFSRAEIHSLSIERSLRKQLKLNRPPKQFNGATLWEGRLAELQALRKHRHQQGKLPPGQRDSWLLLAGVAMSWLAPPAAMQRELYGLAREVAGWTDAESKSRMQAVIKRAHQAGKGETVEWHGQKVDARYQFKDSTIIDWLDITSEEMQCLNFKHLAHDGLKKARKREKDRKYDEKRRRAAGAQTRAQYEQQAQERRSKAFGLRGQGLSYQRIATQLECSKAEVIRLLKGGQGASRCMVA